MGYKIIKGWSDDSPMDYPLSVKTGNSVTPGHVFCLADSGEAEEGTYSSDGTDSSRLPFFCIDYDAVNGNVIGLTGNFMVELESDLFDTGVYTSNLGVTSKSGKICIPDDKERIVAYVIKYSSTAGKLIITWKDN